MPCAGSGLASNVCRKITGQLTCAITQQEDVAMQLEALDILSDMLSRCGGRSRGGDKEHLLYPRACA